MTDKQIIIDVSDCSELCGTKCHILMSCTNTSKSDSCSEMPNCYYKQLKRKEQEYEELRQYHNKCCEENVKALEELLEKYNQVARDFYNGKYCNKENCNLLKTKEQECEELKEAQKNSRCAWKSLEGTFCPEAQEQLNAYKMEAEEGKEINAELKAENDLAKQLINWILKFFELTDYDWQDDQNEISALIEDYIDDKNSTIDFVNDINKGLFKKLTEIKEIAETCSFTDGSELLLSRIEQILQKISEVEDEHNG